jgi:hypothetical protein
MNELKTTTETVDVGAIPEPGQWLPLKSGELDTMFNDAKQAYDAAKSAYATRDAWLPKWRHNYDCKKRPSLSKFPLTDADGNGRSLRIHIPVVRTVVNGYVAQVTDAVFGNEDLWYADPENEEDEERSRRAMQYQNLWARKLSKFSTVYDELMRRTAVDGTAFLYIPWRKEKRYCPANPLDMQSRGSDSIIYDGPKPEVVPCDKLRIWPTVTTDPQDDIVTHIFHERGLSRSELMKGIKSGRYRLPKGTDPAVLDSDSSGANGIKPSRYNAVDTYMDVSVGGQEIGIVLTWLVDYDLMVGAVSSPTGTWRPFIGFTPDPDMDGIRGVGIPQKIDGIERAITQLAQQGLDIGTMAALLASTPFVSVGSDLPTGKPFLGAPVLVNQGGVTFAPPPSAAEHGSLLQLFWDMVQKSTGVNANFMGQVDDARPTATEVNTVTNLANSLFKLHISRMDNSLELAGDMIARLFYLYLPETVRYMTGANEAEQAALKEQYAPMMEDWDEEKQKAVLLSQMGQPTPIPEQPTVPTNVSRETGYADFAPGLTWRVNGSTSNLNKDQQKMTAQMKLQAMMECPFATPSGLWQAWSDYLTAMDERNIARLIGEQPDDAQGPAMPRGEPEQPRDTGPKVNISIPFVGLPPDAQSALLEGLGLPGEMAGQGYRDQLETARTMAQNEARMTTQADDWSDGSYTQEQYPMGVE